VTQVSKLVTEVIADSSKFSAGINKAKAEARSFGNAVAAGAAVAAVALTSVAAAAASIGREVLQSADKISRLYDDTRKLGTSVAAFQELSVAASEAGVSAEGLSNLLSNMNKRLGEAQLGGGQAGKALQALGLSLNQLSGLSTDEKFTLIASKLKDLNNLQLQAAIASDLFGKAGKEALALYNSDIDGTIKKVRELGFTLTDSQGEALDKLSETKAFIGTIWEGFKENVSAEVAPAFQEFLDRIQETIKGMGGIKAIAKDVGDSITAAMHSMTVGIKAAGTALEFFKNIFNSLGGSGLLSFLDKVLTTAWSPVRGLIASNTSRPDMGTSRAKTVTADDMASMTKKAEEVKNTQQTEAASRALAVYNDETKKATDAVKAMKEEALKTANVLDKFHAIKDLLAAPGKNQADSIMQKAVEASPVNLASSEKFQEIFTRALTDARKGDMSNIQDSIQSLEGLIVRAKEGTDFSGGADGGAVFSNNPDQDVSGLTTALNELKAFLAQKGGPKDQKVEVKIKVDASKDFLTTVTTSQTFKEAVDAEFDERLAQAARGNVP
jgi:hypothetical protein